MIRAACLAFFLACQGLGLRLESSVANSGALAELKESGESAWPSDYTMKDVIRLLWYGYDIGHEMQGFLARAPKVIYQVRHIDTARNETKGLPPHLVVLGPKDSGASLLMELLELNYMTELKRACGWEKYWVDHDRPWLGHLYCRVWSHGLIDETVPEGAKSLYKVLSHQPNITIANTVVLFVVKSPFATLESWRTAFREKNPCIKRPAAEWGKPCTASDVSWKDAGNRLKDAKLEVKSTMDLYNKYMRMYHQIVKDGRFKAAKWILYEDLVEDPADIVDQIGSLMHWHLKGNIIGPEAIGEGGHPGAGRPEMLAEVKNRTWQGRIEPEIQKLWCKGLDFRLFNDLIENQYSNADFPHQPYGYDCPK
mmetsp:Transcript_87785/g.256609  ORF Transcript_87785/g.256609 Transcript_87785/m.256609 type:complete len:367 (+) Transcript_87785:52-1152(+)